MGRPSYVESWLSEQCVSINEETDPHTWTTDYIAKLYGASISPPSRAFVGTPLSVESLILYSLIRGEVASLGRLSEESGKEIVERAARDPHVKDLARWFVYEAAINGPPIPVNMHSLAYNFVRNVTEKGRRGERGWKLLNRDLAGVTAMLVLTSPDGFGLHASRNSTGTDLCARDVLCRATEGTSWAAITSDIADGIWRRRNELLLRFDILGMLSAIESLGHFLDRPKALALLNELEDAPTG